MRVSLSWLRTHLDTSASVAELSDALTRLGLEVDGIEDRGAALASFRIARVLEANQHPNADRLRACLVDAGDGGAPVSVVCGAPNARAGMRAVFAPPDSYIPGTGITLKTAKVRGVESAGMLLSYREMGLGEDHTGIVDLPEDAPVGQPYAAWAGLDDPVFEISITPNRGDAFSVRGIARDLAAAGIGTLRPWSPQPVPEEGPSRVRWQLDMTQACPWILGRIVRGVRNGPSPDWLRRRLEGVGLRPINALVDITNFFTHDLGRPLHVFDADRVSGDVLTLRPGREDERFLALNGKEYAVGPADCVIADAAGVQSLAGVIGGEPTGCQEGTTTVFLECALFDPVYVALAGRRHSIVSDARQRFERGVDPSLLPAAVEAATRMILDLCGGEASTITGAGGEPAWRRTASMRFERLALLGGMAVPPDEAVAGLERLGFQTVQHDERRVTVSVPPWRNDVAMADARGYGLGNAALDQAPALSQTQAAAAAEGCAEVEPECDLLEEVLRLRGLDRVPPVSMPSPGIIPPPVLTQRQVRAALARRVLAARGLTECVTFSFLAHGTAALFGEAQEALRLLNPIASDLDQMRPTPVATLLLAAGRNAARGLPDAALFELGPAFGAPEGAATQEAVAAGVRSGHTPRHSMAPARPVSWMDAKADALETLLALGIPAESLTATRDAPGWYHPGRSGVLRQGPKLVLARFGALHPRVLAALDLQGPAVAFEVFLDRIPDPKRRKRAAPELPPFQPVRRDFAFLVGRDVTAEAVLRAARGAERALIAGVSLFDVFEGTSLPEGQKSVAVEVVFQPRERTLTDAEIEAASTKVVAAVQKATGAALRS